MQEASTILEVTGRQSVTLRDVSREAFAQGVHTRAGNWGASIRQIVGGMTRCFAGFSLLVTLTSAIADAKELNDPEAIKRIADALEMGEMAVADLIIRPQMLAKVTAELRRRNTQASFSVLAGMNLGA